ncbi:thiol-disulfide oxidoreductase DCC family protein [Bacillus sp. T3]|uniref:thiol-disulfide oxidoreductase DCC family protein n=1 Tax=Bacillus sp. T3 TaxID=467262 RepID=UPI0029828EB1|nr:thiol-disulfide oxidoreductase DCC family protein [Bacillus sp. T3]
MNNIILFDGLCNFCDHSVQFIIKRDNKAIYKFTSIQSDVGQKILQKYKVPTNVDSLILISNNKYYTKTSAALRICKNLKGGWQLLQCLLIVPKPIRDFFYTILSKNRYKWFGRKESCTIPSPELRKRFL